MPNHGMYSACDKHSCAVPICRKEKKKNKVCDDHLCSVYGCEHTDYEYGYKKGFCDYHYETNR